MKPLILDPDQTFAFVPESMGDEPPTFHLRVLTKKQRDAIVMGPALEAAVAAAKVEDEVGLVQTMTVKLMKEITNSLPDFEKQIKRIENISTIEDGEVKNYESLDDPVDIRKVYQALPMFADLEIRMAVIGHSFLTEEEEALLE